MNTQCTRPSVSETSGRPVMPSYIWPVVSRSSSTRRNSPTQSDHGSFGAGHSGKILIRPDRLPDTPQAQKELPAIRQCPSKVSPRSFLQKFSKIKKWSSSSSRHSQTAAWASARSNARYCLALRQSFNAALVRRAQDVFHGLPRQKPRWP